MEYKCEICNKKYSSYQSKWIHDKKYHNKKNTNNNSVNTERQYKPSPTTIQRQHNVNTITDATKKYCCNFCNGNFTTRQAKNLHIKKYCKLKDAPLTAPTTMNQQNANTINNINNQQINNNQYITINQFGHETFRGLTQDDIVKIAYTGANMPVTCIKKINFNKKIPENHSFCTTSLEGKHFTKINHKTQKPEKINKAEFINQILKSSLKIIDGISVLAEHDESYRERIPPEYLNKIYDILRNKDKFYNKKNMKAFYNSINDMSYNYKDIVMDTWKCIQPPEDNSYESSSEDSDGTLLIDENYDYRTSDDEDDNSSEDLDIIKIVKK